MIDLTNIRSLSEFQRNAKEYVQRLRKTGKPEVLTINGQAELVIQSAEGYQRLLESAELAESVRVLRERLKAADQGSRELTAEQVLGDIRARLGIEGKD
jgi:PHD/YefM family antitoxin component YafN of YafNO toxin-antitoxin module